MGCSPTSATLPDPRKVSFLYVELIADVSQPGDFEFEAHIYSGFPSIILHVSLYVYIPSMFH